MAKVLLLLSTFVLYITSSASQCITANDIIVNETSIETATNNLREGSTRFSLELLRTLNANQRGNKEAKGLFFSPHSIWSALVVTYMGARGVTEQEMRNVLGIGDTDKITTWEAFRNIRNFDPYETDAKESSYNSANRIYFQEGTTFKNCMQEMLDNDIAFVDFLNNPDEARESINIWVEKQTQQRIKDLIPANSINALTKMVIANAVYFKEAWLRPFEPQKTARRRFTTSSRQEIFVTMMTTKGRFLYVKSEELNCYALELPYTGNSLSMMILLPNNRFNGVDILANNLTPERLQNLVDDMYQREVTVSIPKFKLEESFELSSILNKMGLRTLFDPRRVDLSGFTGQREYLVDGVHHKTFIDVNEEGTEAAAATGLTSYKSGRRAPVSFIADYPFIYFIRNSLSNTILFLGTIRKPQDSTN